MFLSFLKWFSYHFYIHILKNILNVPLWEEWMQTSLSLIELKPEQFLSHLGKIIFSNPNMDIIEVTFLISSALQSTHTQTLTHTHTQPSLIFHCSSSVLITSPHFHLSLAAPLLKSEVGTSVTPDRTERLGRGGTIAAVSTFKYHEIGEGCGGGGSSTLWNNRTSDCVCRGREDAGRREFLCVRLQALYSTTIFGMTLNYTKAFINSMWGVCVVEPVTPAADEKLSISHWRLLFDGQGAN